MSNHSVGQLGFGIVNGHTAEAQLMNNYVPHGLLVGDPTTASAQLAGTGNGSYRVNISTGIIHVNGGRLQVAAAADLLLETAGNIMASGNSKVYTILYWRHPDTGVIARKIVPGAVAATGSQVPPTVAEIEAGIPDGAVWVAIAEVTVNRTGDTTVTQSADNLVRPSLIPVTKHRQ